MQLLFANRIEPPGSQFQVQATPSPGNSAKRTIAFLWEARTSRKTFLRNHLDEIVSVDFFTVSTVRLRVLFVFFGSEASPPGPLQL